MTDREFKSLIRLQVRQHKAYTDAAVRAWLRGEHNATYVRAYVRGLPGKAMAPNERALITAVLPSIPPPKRKRA